MFVLCIYFLVVVPVRRLTLLVSDDGDTVDTRNTALTIDHLLRVLPIQIKVRLIVVLHVVVYVDVRVELVLWIQGVQSLQIGVVKSIFKTLLKGANYVKILLVLTVVISWVGMTRCSLLLSGSVLAGISIYNHLRVALLRWQFKVNIMLFLELLLVLIPRVSAMCICRARSNSESISDSIHRCKSELICQLITAVDIWERAITLVVESFQFLILSEHFVLGSVFARSLWLLDGLLSIYSL